jgi:hypothetical protein
MLRKSLSEMTGFINPSDYCMGLLFWAQWHQTRRSYENTELPTERASAFENINDFLPRF